MESGLTVSHESKRQMSVVVGTIYYIPLVGMWEWRIGRMGCGGWGEEWGYRGVREVCVCVGVPATLSNK